MLSRPQDFAAIQGSGTTKSHPLFSARFLRTDLETTRFGLSTGRRLGNAVVRNRVRRRLREALRVMAPSFQPGWDVLIIARPAIVEADHDALVGALHRMLVRGGVFGGATSMKRIGIGLDQALPDRVRLAAGIVSIRADLFALRGTGDREVRSAEGELDGRQAHRQVSPMESGRV